MRVLIVAHPDDEVLWFAAETFDRIVIVFGDYGDGRSGDGRRKALKEHPLSDRITHLDLKQSNYWRDKTKRAEYDEGYHFLCVYLRTLKMDSVTTHNAMGEYQHADHLLVHKACMMTLNCPVNGQKPGVYRKIRDVYVRNGCWTWY